MRLVHLPLEEWDCLLLAAFSFCLHCGHVSGLQASLRVSPTHTVPFTSNTSVFWFSSVLPPPISPYQPLFLPSPPLGKGLPITHHPPAHFMHERVPGHIYSFLCCSAFRPFLVKMTIFWEWEEVPEIELCSALKKRAAGSRVSPPPHGRVKGIGEDLTSSREGNLSPLLFLLQEQGRLPALPIGKISFSLPLASSPRWVQSVGGDNKNSPFPWHHSTEA